MKRDGHEGGKEGVKDEKMSGEQEGVKDEE